LADFPGQWKREKECPTEEVLYEALLALYSAGGEPVLRDSTAPYFDQDRYPSTWGRVNVLWKEAHGETIGQFSLRRGLVEPPKLKAPKVVPVLTEDAICEAWSAASQEIDGKIPVSFYVEGEEWKLGKQAIERALQEGLYGLADGGDLMGLLVRRGMRKPRATKGWRHGLGTELALKAQLEFMADHGRWPNLADPAAPYIEACPRFRHVDQWLRKNHGTTLLEQRNLHRMNSVLPAVHGWKQEHGSFPTARSGDASAYFGWKERWGAINALLKKHGSSLVKVRNDF